MRTFLSVLLALTFLFQPLVTYASICEELAKVVNKISDAVGKVGEIKDEKFDEIQKGFEEKQKEVQEAYDKAKSDYDSKKSSLDTARRNLDNASESEKARYQEEYNSAQSAFNSAQTSYNNASTKLNDVNDKLKIVTDVIKTLKSDNKSANEKASSANDNSRAIVGDKVEDKTKTGKMENINASAINMQTGQDALKKAGENLGKATTALEGASKFVGKIKDVFDKYTWFLTFIPTVGEVVKGITTVLTAAKDILKVASDATKILSETFLSMAEKGKTSDADFIKTLAAKSVANAPELLCDIGKTVIDVVGLDKLLGKAGEKLKDVGSKFLNNHEGINNLVKALKFDAVGEAAENFAKKMNSGVTSFITDHFTKDAEKTTKLITTGAKKLFGSAVKSAEKFYKDVTGVDTGLTASKSLLKQGTDFLKKKALEVTGDAAQKLGNMIEGED